MLGIRVISTADIQYLMTILSEYQYDLSGCLANCSNQGTCMYNTTLQLYVCLCQANFIGSACQKDVRPCSQFPCLNNGLCSNVNTSADFATNATFTCDCLVNFNGDYCENEVNVCANVTCSGNGYCSKNGTIPMCNCFQDYFGDICQTEGSFIQVVRDVKWTSLVVFVLCMAFFVVTVILNDVWSYFIRRSYAKQQQERKSSHNRESNMPPISAHPVQFTYYHHRSSISSQT